VGLGVIRIEVDGLLEGCDGSCRAAGDESASKVVVGDDRERLAYDGAAPEGVGVGPGGGLFEDESTKNREYGGAP
jgi:hypothetical protein